MENLKELINTYFENYAGYCDYSRLKKNLNIKGEEQTDIFNHALNALVEDGCLFFDEKKGYHILTNELGYAYGEIEINKAGTGFVHTKDGYTILIENNDLNGALDSDKVLVSSICTKRKDYFSGEIFKVLKRASGNLLYEVVGNGLSSTLVPYDTLNNIDIQISKNELKNLLDGEIILVRVGVEKLNEYYKAEIIKSIGFKSDPDIDIKLLANKYNINIDFPVEVINEANLLPKSVTEEDLIDRVDLRDKDFVTIDCDNTKDRDDAVFVEKLDNGNYKLYVSISSVNYYVKKDSKLYSEAINRCLSYYPDDACIPMFPHIISNGICSLNPNVDRLTKTCEIEIDACGNIVNYNIYNSVINSRKAMKYSDVNKAINNEYVSEYEDYEDLIKLMYELSCILNESKKNRNYINFMIPDINVIRNDKDNIVEFKETGIGNAEDIIENFMLLANQVVAENYSFLPFIYRIHEAPNELTIRDTVDLLRASGLKIPKISNVNEKTINFLLNYLNNSEESKIIRTELLKSMKRARYDVNNLGHFALQLDNYCHFTSPIRRIADFIIHGLIDEYENFDYSEDNINKIEQEFELIAESATRAEKISKQMEQEALLMRMAEYMEKHIGERYSAYITEVYPSGLFVKTTDEIIGKVKLENIDGDKYRYDYDKKMVVGKKNHETYKIGDKIYVIVKDASKQFRTINFEIPIEKQLVKR